MVLTFPVLLVQVNASSASALAVDAVNNVKYLATVRDFNVASSIDLQRSQVPLLVQLTTLAPNDDLLSIARISILDIKHHAGAELGIDGGEVIIIVHLPLLPLGSIPIPQNDLGATFTVTVRSSVNVEDHSGAVDGFD